ncbi:MAG: bifunctional tRNA (5-methylaminomethyl-2-thiouridine)(34)-methyltransferase MnmD/FAD-dependent 5-carboxymethylaminomethyl-2-thiouridine(34) oxidoreductase MnmC, partial [Azoarcus sp.]|nr:bifunctional tRNA (5-methylaminomethyl-2-thiouridine)(34)-methyltransferase MnmD/FAD-dependent 5-carboxymethylaminomethyl-2-thiouridine(34) oxidoreductase MnmC [Azoarcus sp.]
HAHNFDRLRHLTGLHAPGDPSRWWGRVGWRVQTADRLPVAGPVPLWPLPPGTRADQARLLPRTPGLHLLCALGGRGLTLAPLLADVVAARIAGAPLPVEQALLDAVDPGRWLVRAARGRSASGTPELEREPHP